MLLRLEVLRPERLIDANGQVVVFTPKDIRQIAESYSPEVFEAPLTFGHHASDEMPYGSVRSLEYDPDTNAMVAYVGNLSDACDLAGVHSILRIRHCSAGLYPPGAPGNPIGDQGYYLQHIAAVLHPAVKQQAEPVLVIRADSTVMLESPQTTPPNLSEMNMNQNKCACADSVAGGNGISNEKPVTPVQAAVPQQVTPVQFAEQQHDPSVLAFAEREKRLVALEKAQAEMKAELDKRYVSLFLAEHKAALTPSQTKMAEGILLAVKSSQPIHLSETDGKTVDLSAKIEQFISSFNHPSLNPVLFSEAAKEIDKPLNQESITSQQVTQRLKEKRGEK